VADWAERFRAHVAFDGSSADLIRTYQRDRHALEARYQAMSDAGRAALAVGQGATYVVAAPPLGRDFTRPENPLELVHAEGVYALYRVRAANDRVASAASQGGGVQRQQ
jgi:hypothetical protein